MLLEAQRDLEVVGAAGSGVDAVHQVRQLHPDVIILDIDMPEMNGLEAARQICESNEGIKIIILSMHGGTAYVLEALRAGVKGYLLKAGAGASVIDAVRAVHNGRTYLSPEIMDTVIEHSLNLQLALDPERPSVDPLTESEMAVLRLVAQGQDNQDIAQSLNISAHTVSNRLRTIYKKLHVANRTQAALYALRQGWSTLDEPPL